MAKRTPSAKRRINLSASSDLMLLELTREGVEQAFGELWSRHSSAVTAMTKSFTGFEAEDIVQEAFLRVYSSVKKAGELPAVFRPYVAATARRIAIDKSRKEGDVVHGAFEEELDSRHTPVGDHADVVLDNSTTAKAFKALPTRHRELLWYRDVEDLPVKEIARYVGMSENSTSVLIKRAREAFKAAWISVQLSAERNLPAACAATVPKLAKFARGKLSSLEHQRVSAHIADCTHCGPLAAEANELHSNLALVLLPLLLLGGAPAYKAWIQSEGNRSFPPTQANIITVGITGAKALPVAVGAALLTIPKPAFALAAVAATLLVVGTGVVALTRAVSEAPESSPEHTVSGTKNVGGGEGANAAGEDGALDEVPDTSQAEADAGANPGGALTSRLVLEGHPVAALQSDAIPVPLQTESGVDAEVPAPVAAPADPVVVYPALVPLGISMGSDMRSYSGTATPGATIAVGLNAAPAESRSFTVLVDGSGAWMFTIPGGYEGMTIDINFVQLYDTADGTEFEGGTAFGYEMPA